MVDGFADAAALAVALGAATASRSTPASTRLLRQFLSGLTNLRGDDYGADRLRFAARGAAPPCGAPSGPTRCSALRLSCDELAPWAGVDARGRRRARRRALAEQVDYLVVVRGLDLLGAGHPARRPRTEPGFNLDLVARRSGPRSTAPGAGRRPGLASSTWPGRVGTGRRPLRPGRDDPGADRRPRAGRQGCAAGAAEPIRPCILCNQTCQVRDNRNPIVTLRGRAPAGPRARRPRPVGPAPAPRARCWSSAAGVAGLEAARVLAVARAPRHASPSARPALGGVLRRRPLAAGRERSGAASSTGWTPSARRLGVDRRARAPRSPRAEVDAALAAGTARRAGHRRHGSRPARRHRRPTAPSWWTPPTCSRRCAAGDAARRPARRAGRGLRPDRRADRVSVRRAARRRGPPAWSWSPPT